jgi:predicted HAD superfamily phosphohydrolase YqeG
VKNEKILDEPYYNREFSPSTEYVAAHLGIRTVGSITEVKLSDYEEKKGLVLDADGTLYPYGNLDGPKKEIIDWVQQAYEFLEGKIVIVSNNRKVHQMNNVAVSNRTNVFNYKMSINRNKQAVQSLGVPTEEILAITDSPSDIMANRIVGIGLENQILVRSLGAHPIQKMMHERAYPALSQASHRIIEFSKTIYR